MENSKPWYLSNTVWASIIQMAVGVLTATGFINDIAGATLVTDGPGVIIGLVTTALSVWGLYGRVRATKQIAPTA